jgi:hypothetical protein
MSHFMMHVLTENKPTQEELAALLQPYHEFECTGTDDEYVVAVDQTQEKRDEYESETNSMLVGPEGQMVGMYANQFYREFTPEELKLVGGQRMLGSGAGHGLSWSSRDWEDGKGYRAKVRYTPEGWEEREVPVKDGQTFREWLRNGESRPETGPGAAAEVEADDRKFGYTVINAEGEVEATYRRTNPNKKWDWWVIGGRYAGRLTVKPGVATVLSPPRPSFFGLREEPEPAPPPGATNQAQLGDIDWQGQWNEGWREGEELWDKTHAALVGLPPLVTFEAMREKYPEDAKAARDAYWRQPAMLALKEAFPDEYEYSDQLQALKSTREAVAETHKNRKVSSYGYLLEGQWRTRGEMGWFGMASNEEDPAVWYAHTAKMYKELPRSYWITIVDCHI